MCSKFSTLVFCLQYANVLNTLTQLRVLLVLTLIIISIPSEDLPAPSVTLQKPSIAQNLWNVLPGPKDRLPGLPRTHCKVAHTPGTQSAGSHALLGLIWLLDVNFVHTVSEISLLGGGPHQLPHSVSTNRLSF